MNQRDRNDHPAAGNRPGDAQSSDQPGPNLAMAYTITPPSSTERGADLSPEQDGSPTLLRQALDHRERTLHAVFAGALDAILLVDDEGSVVDLNPAAAALFGLPAESLIGRTAAPFVNPALDPSAPGEEAAGSGELWDEVELARADGSSAIVEYAVTFTVLPGLHLIVARDITRRRRVETDLLISVAHFRQLAEAMPYLIWSVLPDGQLDYYNHQWQTYHTPHLRGNESRGWKPVIHPEDLPLTISAWKQAREAGAVYETEHRVLMADGSFRWHLSRAVPVHNKDGQVEKWYGTAIDIHDRKLAEQALKNSERKFHAIFDGTLDAMLLADDEARYVDANPAACRLLGVTREEILQTSVADLTPLGNREQVARMWQDFLEAGHMAGEFTLVRKDGTAVETEFRATANVLPQLHLSVMRDISDRKQVEASLVASQRRFRQLADAMPQLVWTADPDGQVDYYNRPAADFGTRQEEDGSWKWALAVHPADVARTEAAWVHSVATGEVYEIEHRVRTDGGEYRWFLSRGLPAYDDEDYITKWYGTATDIHEQKLAEQAAREKELRYRTLFDTMAQGVVYLDSDCLIVDANPAAERILGLAREELVGRRCTDAQWQPIHEDGSRFPSENHPAAIALRTGRELSHVVMGILNPLEQEYRWINIHAVPLFQAGESRASRVYTTFEDITELRRAEQHRYLLAAIVESSTDAILGKDLNGTITSWNDGAERLYGYTAAEMVGRSVKLLVPDNRADEIDAMTDAVRQGQAINQLETTRLRKDGRSVLISLSASPIKDNSGRIIGVSTISRDITAEKEVESQLRLQAQLLDSVSEAVIATDLDGHITFWGKGAEVLYGYSQEVASGQFVGDILKMDIIPLEEQWSQSFLAGAPSEFEALQYRSDGTAIWASIAVSVVADSFGRPAGYIGICRDVTERRQHLKELAAIADMARALRSTQRRAEMLPILVDQFAAFLNASSVSIILVDPASGDAVVEYAWGLEAETAGATITHGRGITWQTILSRNPYFTADLTSDPHAIIMVPLDGRCAAASIPLLTGEREPIGVLWLMRETPFSDREARVLEALVALAGNAIHRASLFDQMEAQTRQVQRLIDSVGDGLLLLDSDLRILLANPAAATHLRELAPRAGETPLIGFPLLALGGRPLLNLLQSGEIHSFDVSTGSGQQAREFEIGVHPMAENGMRGWVLVLRDMTDERERQEFLQQQDRLAAVGQLAAGIAHDFTNIMSAIVLYSQALQKHEDLSERGQRAVTVIYNQALHATNLIHQILDFSRRSVMEKGPLSIVPFLRELAKMWARILPENILLQLQVDDTSLVVSADPTRLQQALMNLAINARDAMPDGGSLTIGIRRLQVDAEGELPLPEMAPGSWLRLDLTDTGTGIPDDILGRIFDPFFTTKPPGKGTGLGLAQVYGIIRQHDGYIDVESQPGDGTTFTIYLPLAPAMAVETMAAPPPLPGPREGPPLRVLVVEDEESARRAVVETLQSLGYEALPASNGQVGLAEFEAKAGSIDLVLTDLVMPEMGGEALYQALCRQDPDVKLVVMTGYPLEDAGRSLLEQGIVSWIRKPFTASELVDVLEKALAQ